MFRGQKCLRKAGLGFTYLFWDSIRWLNLMSNHGLSFGYQSMSSMRLASQLFVFGSMDLMVEDAITCLAITGTTLRHMSILNKKFSIPAWLEYLHWFDDEAFLQTYLPWVKEIFQINTTGLFTLLMHKSDVNDQSTNNANIIHQLPHPTCRKIKIYLQKWDKYSYILYTYIIRPPTIKNLSNHSAIDKKGRISWLY